MPIIYQNILESQDTESINSSNLPFRVKNMVGPQGNRVCAPDTKMMVLQSILNTISNGLRGDKRFPVVTSDKTYSVIHQTSSIQESNRDYIEMRQIRRILVQLAEQGLIILEKLPRNKWYRYNRWLITVSKSYVDDKDILYSCTQFIQSVDLLDETDSNRRAKAIIQKKRGEKCGTIVVDNSQPCPMHNISINTYKTKNSFIKEISTIKPLNHLSESRSMDIVEYIFRKSLQSSKKAEEELIRFVQYQKYRHGSMRNACRNYNIELLAHRWLDKKQEKDKDEKRQYLRAKYASIRSPYGDGLTAWQRAALAGAPTEKRDKAASERYMDRTEATWNAPIRRRETYGSGSDYHSGDLLRAGPPINLWLHVTPPRQKPSY